MHFLGKWLRLPMAIEILMHFWMCSITLPSSTDVNSFRKRLWRSNESTHFTEYLEGVSGIAIQHIRWRLQSSKHVSERAGGCFFSIGPSVLIGLCSLYRVETSAPGLSGYYWYVYIKNEMIVNPMQPLQMLQKHQTNEFWTPFCDLWITNRLVFFSKNPGSQRSQWNASGWPARQPFSSGSKSLKLTFPQLFIRRFSSPRRSLTVSAVRANQGCSQISHPCLSFNFFRSQLYTPTFLAVASGQPLFWRYVSSWGSMGCHFTAKFICTLCSLSLDPFL